MLQRVFSEKTHATRTRNSTTTFLHFLTFIKRGYPDTYNPKPDKDITEDADSDIDKTITPLDMNILRHASNRSKIKFSTCI